jgi:hypothetical protein
MNAWARRYAPLPTLRSLFWENRQKFLGFVTCYEFI